MYDGLEHYLSQINSHLLLIVNKIFFFKFIIKNI